MGWLTNFFTNRKANHARTRTLPSGAYRNAVPIPVDADAEWLRIVPVGAYPEHHDGAHEVTADMVQQMATNQRDRYATDVVVDIDHDSLWGYTRAAGWINEIEARDDGLYMRMPEWTRYGQDFIENREYRFFSPVYQIDARDKQGTSVGARLLSVALTNTPYFDEGEIDAARNTRTYVNGPLADLLNDALDDEAGEDAQRRDSLIDEMAEAAGIERATVLQILRADIEAVPLERLEGFAEVLSLSLDDLIEALPEDHRQTVEEERSNARTNPETFMERDDLIQQLGLADDATDEDIKAALAATKLAREAAAAEAAAAEAAETDDPPAGGDTSAVSEEQIEVAVNRALAARGITAPAEQLVNQAVADHKILPADKPIWLNSANADFEGTKARLDAIAKNAVKPGRVKVNTTTNGTAQGKLARGRSKAAMDYVNQAQA